MNLTLKERNLITTKLFQQNLLLDKSAGRSEDATKGKSIKQSTPNG